jgi:hypothetical protein
MPVEIVATTYRIPDGAQEVELAHDGQTKRFTAEGLSEYVAALAAVRGNLLPPVPLEVPVGQSLPTQLDPHFSTAANAMVNGSSLYFRHSGFGWLGVIMHPGDCADDSKASRESSGTQTAASTSRASRAIASSTMRPSTVPAPCSLASMTRFAQATRSAQGLKAALMP